MYNLMLHSFAVAIGGAMGAIFRYWMSLSLATWSVHWPVATFSVNMLGSLIMGMGVAYFASIDLAEGAHSWLKYLLLTGCLGGLTTFSTFSIEALGLVQQARYVTALSYMLASMILCVLAAALGFYAMQRFFNF